MDEVAYTSIILHLSNSILRKVGKLETTKELWEKLKKLYVKKSTSNKFYLLENFFSFKIDPYMNLDGNFNVFNKLVQDIINCGETMSEEYKTIILLNVIPDTYKEVKNVIKYGKHTLTPKIIIDSLRSKEIELKHESERNYGEIHMMRGRSQLKSQEEGSKKRKGRSKSKTQGKGKKCYDCGKTRHFIKDCYAKKGKQKEKEKDHEKVNAITSYDQSEVY